MFVNCPKLLNSMIKNVNFFLQILFGFDSLLSKNYNLTICQIIIIQIIIIQFQQSFFFDFGNQTQIIIRKFTIILNQFYRLTCSDCFTLESAKQIMSYNNQTKQKYSRIIFSKSANVGADVQKLKQEEKDEIKQILAQKIVYQCVYREVPDPLQNSQLQKAIQQYNIPSFFGTVCCCFFPQDNRQNFDISTNLFLRRCCGTLVFCRSDFMQIKKQQQVQATPDLYGPLWLSLTYIILLIIAANLNLYFTNPDTFAFQFDFIYKAFGIQLIYQFAESLIYSAVVGCLGSHVSSTHSTTLIGYSLILYFLPTFLCSVPSVLGHMLSLGLGALFRLIFLTRNYGSKLDAKVVVMFFVILIIQALHFYTILKVIFQSAKGQSIQAGTNQIFHLRQFYQ